MQRAKSPSLCPTKTVNFFPVGAGFNFFPAGALLACNPAIYFSVSRRSSAQAHRNQNVGTAILSS